jgi:glycosyltransferase involved in cell wall biosynthesis
MEHVLESGMPPVDKLVTTRERLRGYGARSSSSHQLRIAVLAPPWFPVPPARYGGTEAVVNLLVEGLVAEGHDVTLFATGDSTSSANLVSYFGRSRPDSLGQTQADMLQALSCIAEADRFDVVSDHTGALGLSLSNLTSTPFLNTVHGALAGEAGALYRQVCALTPGAALVSLTESHRNTASDLPWSATIPNAIALDDHPCRTKRGGEYLFWLGRMSVDKGPVTAIEVARAAGMPLVLAGKLRAADEQLYFEEEVRPLLGGDITYVGEIDLHERVRLMHGAHALINPIAWDEPFGLVMVEAMACGVPVIATPRGSVPEIVIDGENGWIAATVAEMAAAVQRCHEIDPSVCREIAEFCYSPARMVLDYLDAFGDVIEHARGRSTFPARTLA